MHSKVKRCKSKMNVSNSGGIINHSNKKKDFYLYKTQFPNVKYISFAIAYDEEKHKNIVLEKLMFYSLLFPAFVSFVFRALPCSGNSL